MALGIQWLTEAIEPSQPFKGTLCFNASFALIKAIKNGVDKFGRELSPEQIKERIAENFFVEKIDSLSFTPPETGFKKFGGGASKQAELQRLNDRFQFLAEKLAGEEKAKEVKNVADLAAILLGIYVEDDPKTTMADCVASVLTDLMH